MKGNLHVRFLEGLIVVTQLANSTATFFPRSAFANITSGPFSLRSLTVKTF